MQARFRHIPEALIPLFIVERIAHFCRISHLSSIEEEYLLYLFPRSPIDSFRCHPMKVQCMICAVNCSLTWSIAGNILRDPLFFSEVLSMIHDGYDAPPVEYKGYFATVNKKEIFNKIKTTCF